jgi:hypothetical protein
MAKFLERLKPKTVEELDADLSRLQSEFQVGRFDTLMGEVYDNLNKAIEHAELSAKYGKVKKQKDTEELHTKRLEFLRALKAIRPHWKAAKEGK